jgi:hypothetical protein
MNKFWKKQSSTTKFLEIVLKIPEKVWLRSEKVDPKFSNKCSFWNGQRHIFFISASKISIIYEILVYKIDNTTNCSFHIFKKVTLEVTNKRQTNTCPIINYFIIFTKSITFTTHMTIIKEKSIKHLLVTEKRKKKKPTNR